MYVSKGDYCRACAVDLYEWVLEHHSDRVVKRYGSLELITDRNVSIKKGYHGYFVWDTEEKGNNVDYLMNYLDYDYPSAVAALCDYVIEGDLREVTGADDDSEDEGNVSDEYSLPLDKEIPKPIVPKVRKIKLPEAADHTKNVYAFLTKSRGIPGDVVQTLIKRGLLYQSRKGNNCVFATPQGDYCELRGTNTLADKRCAKRDECSDFVLGDHAWCGKMDTCDKYKASPFHGCLKSSADRFWYFSPLPDQRSKFIYICEAAIDAISLYCFHRLLRTDISDTYVSIGGVANQQAIDRIKKYCGDAVVIATDNDVAGNKCRERNSDCLTVCPVGKDWNEDWRSE